MGSLIESAGSHKAPDYPSTLREKEIFHLVAQDAMIYKLAGILEDQLRFQNRVKVALQGDIDAALESPKCDDIRSQLLATPSSVKGNDEVRAAYLEKALRFWLHHIKSVGSHLI